MTKTEMCAPAGHRTVTAAEISCFGSLTGDYSRIHFDHEYSRASGLDGQLAHGLLGASWVLGALTLHAPERVGVGAGDAYLSHYGVRLKRMVFAGDTLSFRWSDDPEFDAASQRSARATAFEVLNQRDEVVSSGRVVLCLGLEGSDRSKLPDPPTRWTFGAGASWLPLTTYYAEDIFENGPRGETLGRTLTESDVVGFTNHVGELNPLYLNEVFSNASRFGGRIAPPMLTFCLGFSEFLRALLTIPMPSTGGSAGHLGDSWNFYRPVKFGDTLRTLYKPVSCVRSRSRPDQALIRFGLQIVNQHDQVVQDGENILMMLGRP